MTVMDSNHEILHQADQVPNVYACSMDGPEVQRLLGAVLEAGVQPYADGNSNPDLGTRKVYVFDGWEFGSDLGRIVEGQVLKDEAEWGQSPEQTAAEAVPYEANSRFFVLVDTPEDGAPVLVGSLRVADCAKGETSETENFYRTSFGQDTEMPNELAMANGREGIWDIVLVAVRPEYQDGINSAWLYYAMHKNSVETAQRGWISNISDHEYKNLKLLGIPFEPIAGAGRVAVQSQMDPSLQQSFGFYYADLDGVQAAVLRQGDRFMSKRSGMGKFVVSLTNIAALGVVERADETPVAMAS